MRWITRNGVPWRRFKFEDEAMQEKDFECDHIGIVSISETESQCMDCLRIWPKRPGFVSDWPEYDRG